MDKRPEYKVVFLVSTGDQGEADQLRNESVDGWELFAYEPGAARALFVRRK